MGQGRQNLFLICITSETNSYTKFQVNISKDGREKSRKLKYDGKIDRLTDGQTNGEQTKSTINYLTSKYEPRDISEDARKGNTAESEQPTWVECTAMTVINNNYLTSQYEAIEPGDVSKDVRRCDTAESEQPASRWRLKDQHNGGEEISGGVVRGKLYNDGPRAVVYPMILLQEI